MSENVEIAGRVRNDMSPIDDASTGRLRLILSKRPSVRWQQAFEASRAKTFEVTFFAPDGGDAEMHVRCPVGKVQENYDAAKSAVNAANAALVAEDTEKAALERYKAAERQKVESALLDELARLKE